MKQSWLKLLTVGLASACGLVVEIVAGRMIAPYLGMSLYTWTANISVVLAGLMVGNYGARIGMSPTTRVSVADFWEYAAFVVNSVIFILVGLEVKAGDFALYLPGVAAAVAVVFAGRIVSVGGSRYSRLAGNRFNCR